jgi:hypothetical protein
VYRNLEDNPDEIKLRVVNVKDLVSSRLQRKTKRIDDLIAIQREHEQEKEDIQL